MKKIKLIKMDCDRFGGPYLQHELGLEEASKNNSRIVFISNNAYPYKLAEQYLEKDFHIIRIPNNIFKILEKLKFIRNTLQVDKRKGYCSLLGKDNHSNSYSEYRNIAPKHDATISLRSKYVKSAIHQKASYRDIERGDVEGLANYLKGGGAKIEYIGMKADERDPLHVISEGKYFIGTNAGPYVCAESLRKKCFIINTIPFLGTNGYHKNEDFILPLPITEKGRVISLEEIHEKKLWWADEEEVLKKGCSYGIIPDHIYRESLKEFLLRLDRHQNHKLSTLQISVKEKIENMCEIKNGPTLPNIYINHYGFR
ncbi:hypothetical protein [Synechococcus sp. MIT S9452]|uniref:hypothetical protein n=1 Tax=Synechococcus sp. MIT S9452 TaxID=3082546 RepID=UPI0039A583BC